MLISHAKDVYDEDWCEISHKPSEDMEADFLCWSERLALLIRIARAHESRLSLFTMFCVNSFLLFDPFELVAQRKRISEKFVIALSGKKSDRS